MSTPVTEQNDTTEAPEAEEQQGDDLSPEVLRKQLEKARKEAASYRTKARELEPLAAKAKEMEEAGRSDLEKLTARAEKAEREHAETEARALRLEVAFEKGLTPAQAKRLVGNDRAELEADAEEILRDFPALKNDGRPRGDVDQGVRQKTGSTNPRQADLDQIEADLRATQRR